jgi:periplasmic divalent cation tolerance protein
VSTAACVVLVTAPTVEVAASLGRALVDERLIACATLVPGARSIYRWKGEVCEVPEVLRLDAAAGHQPWLDWLLASTTR